MNNSHQYGKQLGSDRLLPTNRLRFKPLVFLLTALLGVGGMSSTAYAAPTAISGPMQGHSPSLKFGVKSSTGTLDVSSVLSIEPTGTAEVEGVTFPLYEFSDKDGDGDASLGDKEIFTQDPSGTPYAKPVVQWYQVNPNDPSDRRELQADAGSDGLKYTIKSSDKGFNIGVKVTPTTQRGIPHINLPVFVPNVAYMGEIIGGCDVEENTANPNCIVPPELGGPDPYDDPPEEHITKDPQINPGVPEVGDGNGTITDPQGLQMVIFLDPQRTKVLGTGRAKVGTKYYLGLYRGDVTVTDAQFVAGTGYTWGSVAINAGGEDITDKYSDADIDWHLLDKDATLGGAGDVVLASDDNDPEHISFTTQLTNLNAQARSQIHDSEQGLRLYASIKNSADAAAPVSAPTE